MAGLQLLTQNGSDMSMEISKELNDTIILHCQVWVIIVLIMLDYVYPTEWLTCGFKWTKRVNTDKNILFIDALISSMVLLNMSLFVMHGMMNVFE